MNQELGRLRANSSAILMMKKNSFDQIQHDSNEKMQGADPK